MTPLPEVLAQVPTLNDPQQPFTYEVQGEQIVAHWDIDKASTLHPNEVGDLNTAFTVTVTLDPDKGTWKSKDQETDSGWSAGPGGLSFGKSTFSGKSVNKGFSISLGGGGGGAQVDTWDTDRLKQPLFEFLESHGWSKKRGLFG